MEALKKYNLKRYLLFYTLKSMPIIYILVLGIVCILFFPISYTENATAWIGGYVLAPILCFFVAKFVWKDVKVLNTQWAELKAQGLVDSVMEDYCKSEKSIGSNLRVGETYLFGKGSMRVVSYASIRRIYKQEAERKGKFAWDLWYEDENGQTYFICQLDPMGQSHLELDRIYRKVLKKNPNAETGL